MVGINYDNLLKLRLELSVREKKDYWANINKKFVSDRAFSFGSFTNSSGLNLQKYYDDILKENGEIWVRQELKKVKYIQIINTNIDPLLIDNLSLMFRDLTVLEIKNCNIQKNCGFSKLDVKDIIITDCVIESFDSFSQNKSNVQFIRCNVDLVGNSNILSEKLRFHRVEIDFHRLFLMNNFPNLDDLCIESEVYYDGITNKTKDLKNSFTYLPYSCPNITKLRIEGLVDDLDFLVRLTKLSKVGMASTFGNMADETLVINNKEKLRQLEDRNHGQIEIQKILYGVYDELNNIKYITRSEINRVLALNDFFRTLSFTEQEMNA